VQAARPTAAASTIERLRTRAMNEPFAMTRQLYDGAGEPTFLT
jgi:hypothetical protein